jgi:predicted phage baseplate assembly protein
MGADDLDTCGCCGVPISEPRVHNPPGLSALSYRVGTHGDFLRRMLARLPLEAVEDQPNQLRYPLAELHSRAEDDPAIALLDAWATIGEVLTFYQERIANEGYLPTATERRSVLELARLIGYELNPGVAASAYLAFGIDTAVGAPAEALVPKGTRVQSVPGQDELPQTFETSADITARVEWNRLQPRQLRPQRLGVNAGKLYLLGAGDDRLDVTKTFPLDLDTPLPASGTTAAALVDRIYVVGTATNLHPGDVLLLAGRREGQPTATLVMTVLRVEEEPGLDRTRVEHDVDAPAPTFSTKALSGSAVAGVQQSTLDAKTVDELVVGQTWTDSQLSAWLSVQGWSAADTLHYIFGAYSRPTPPPAPPGAPGAFALRAKVGFFGHNAPAYGSLTTAAQGPFSDWDTGTGLSIWKDSLRPASGNPPYYSDADCFLERSVDGITPNSWAVLELPTKAFTAFRVTAAPESSPVGFSLSAKTTGLLLGTAADGTPLGDSTTDKPEGFKVRKTTAHVLSERLTLAQLPIDDPLGKGTPEETQLTLDRMVLNLAEGQPIAVTGERDDLPGVVVSEVVVLSRVQHSEGFTTLFFTSPGLTYRYIRSTFSLSANVVVATHGETVKQVLSSGDGSQPNQRFELRKPPLTYTASSTTTGAGSSLELRVDGVAWLEAPRLYGLSPADERYLVRMADDGTVSVVFGDGRQGARLPSGVENVVATYRSGIGLAGMVKAGSLSLLMTRPLGLRDVTNPLPASGAADPERRDDARRNAPLTVLAMERVVSLQDIEDFSQAFAGIGKSAAVPLWRNGVHWIHLTVAAAAPNPDPGGLTTAMADHRIDPTSPLRTHLDQALESAKEPSLRIRVDTYQPVFFDLAAKVLIDPRRLWADVEAAAKDNLLSAFAFERRSFGQRVSVSEVVTTIQATPGVLFVDLDALHRFDQAPSLPADDLLVAEGVAWDEDEPEPTGLAQLLLVNPLGITLTPVPPESVT